MLSTTSPISGARMRHFYGFLFVAVMLLNQTTTCGQMLQHNGQIIHAPQITTAPQTGAPPGHSPEHTRHICGVNEDSGCAICRANGLPPKWSDASLIPWENFSFGEYIGPSRTPHVPAYRLRVDDQIEFVFQVSRDIGQAYRLTPGDSIRVTSAVDERLNEANRERGFTIMPDGTIGLELLGGTVVAGKTIDQLRTELDALYGQYYNGRPKIVVTGIETGTRLNDFLASVTAVGARVGQSRTVTVSPDGTIRLPMIGTVGLVGLTLDELEREVNMRYNMQIQGINVTPVLAQRAPRFVYVTGEVAQPGRFELVGPTSAMQSITLAGGHNNGGNLRQIVVFRRDQNWRLMAVKLDLAGGFLGKQPVPSDEIWLRDSDIVLVPRTPILRLADAVELYFSRSLYGIFPAELGVFDAQSIGFQP